MASLAAPRAAALFAARPPPRSFPPPARAQEPLRLRLPLAKNSALGFSASSSPAGRRRKRGSRVAKREDDAVELARTPSELEAEIYEFMERSANPMDFPTKEELLAAGRTDLVDAIATQGGWFTYGWDLDEDEGRGDPAPAPAPAPPPSPVVIEDEIPQEDSRVSQKNLSTSSNGSLMNDSAGPADSCSTASTSCKSMEMEGGEGAGIEGILSRLEKERSWSYAAGLGEKEVNGRSPWKSGNYDRTDEVGVSERSSGSMSSDLGKELLNNYGGSHPSDGTSADANGMRSSAPDMWRIWSLQRAGSPTTEFEAAEIIPNESGRQLDQNPIPGVSMDGKMHTIAHSERNTGNRRNVRHSDAKDSSQNQIRLRIQRLESELKSALNSLRSRTNYVISRKGQESSLNELHRLSDALEFQETEIMNARDKLRSTRAKLAVLEGKMALEIIEAQKIMEEKQRRADTAQKALRLLRTASIVWPNSASEVLLTGSFDGWTSQRRMERSSAGIFSLSLKLYPGRYEIKFVVDGVWTVDPLRPIVHNNGHENNLLVIT